MLYIFSTSSSSYTLIKSPYSSALYNSFNGVILYSASSSFFNNTLPSSSILYFVPDNDDVLKSMGGNITFSGGGIRTGVSSALFFLSEITIKSADNSDNNTRTTADISMANFIRFILIIVIYYFLYNTLFIFNGEVYLHIYAFVYMKYFAFVFLKQNVLKP